jgi:hypothetical protein
LPRRSSSATSRSPSHVIPTSVSRSLISAAFLSPYQATPSQGNCRKLDASV